MTDQPLTTVALPIAQVHPDPNQPRRLLPQDLADAFAAGMPTSEIIAQLRARAERNKWIRAKLQELDGLADSIATDGLYQPIHVVYEQESRYRIEQGERRWWAHHLLLARGDERFRTILAFVKTSELNDTGKLRRQVAENVHRSGFTAIELARAMSARIDEMASAEPELKRREAEQRVGKENGMSDRRVRQFLALLTLVPAVQELAQEANVSESGLRALVGIKEPERQMAALRNLISTPRKKPGAAARETNRKKVGAARRSGRPKHIVEHGKHATEQTANRILSLGRLLQAKPREAIEHELIRRILNDESDYTALSCLRDLIERVLVGAPQRRCGVHDGEDSE